MLRGKKLYGLMLINLLIALLVPLSLHAEAPAVTAIQWINATTDQSISDLSNGMTANLYPYDGKTTIGAVTTGGPIGSVVFTSVDPRPYVPTITRVDNTAPYAMFANTATDYGAGVVEYNRPQTITVTPYSGPNGTGTAGTSLTVVVTFTYDNGCTPERAQDGECDMAWFWSMPTIFQPGDYFSYKDVETLLVLYAEDPDRDSDTLVYSAIDLPPGITLDPANGYITGAATAVGTYFVTSTVTDNHGYSDSVVFQWDVEELSTPEPTQSNTETAEPTQTFTPQPTSTLTSVPSNTATPVIEYVDDYPISEIGEFENFSFTIYDEDFLNSSDLVTVTVSNMPPGLSLSPYSSLIVSEDSTTISYSGTVTTAGSYHVVVTATDLAGHTATRAWQWNVYPPSDPYANIPVITYINGDRGALVGDTVNLAFEVFDYDLFENGDLVTVTVDNLPSGLISDAPYTVQYNGTTINIAGVLTTPGSYDVVLTATDRGGNTDTVAFNWLVEQGTEFPTSTPEVTVEPTSDITPESTAEWTPEPTNEVTPEPTSDVTEEPTTIYATSTPWVMSTTSEPESPTEVTAVPTVGDPTLTPSLMETTSEPE